MPDLKRSGKANMWYHVSTMNVGQEPVLEPRLPGYLQKGEDRRTPRICVTRKWRHSLRSIIVVHLNRFFFVYGTTIHPISPPEHRAMLLREKRIRKSCNDFVLPRDGVINDEHWLLEKTRFNYQGYVEIPKEDYAAALMGFGMFNLPDVEKFEVQQRPFDYRKALAS